MRTSFERSFSCRILRAAALLAAASTGCAGNPTDNCGGPGKPQQVCLVGSPDGGSGSCPSGESEEPALAALVSAPAANIVSGPVAQGSMCCYVVQPVPECP
jgi:hypothetical protein